MSEKEIKTNENVENKSNDSDIKKLIEDTIKSQFDIYIQNLNKKEIKDVPKEQDKKEEKKEEFYI